MNTPYQPRAPIDEKDAIVRLTRVASEILTELGRIRGELVLIRERIESVDKKVS
jgi:hypothetical protein